jgi:hypothetical protein
MREQIAFAQSKVFQNFLAGLNDRGEDALIIHGIFINIHPVWKAIVDYRRVTGFDEHLTFEPGLSWMFYAAHYAALCHASGEASGPYDLSQSPAVWQEICLRQNKKEVGPFIVKLYVIPTTSETLKARRSIEAYARESPFFVSIIDSPMAVLAAQVEGGEDISATGLGTLGGFLKDPSGKSWGVTCGHVAQTTGSTVTLAAGRGNLGIVSHSNFMRLPIQTQAAVCNQYVAKGNNSVDAALIEVVGPHTASNSVKGLGRIDAIFDRTRLNSGNIVSMTGAMSGTNDYEIGGYGVTAKMQLSSGSAYYCFSDLFDFYAPPNAPGWVPRRVAQAAAPRPLQGDSGSWLCFNHSANLYAYFGTMIAVRGAVGIATFADSLRQWAKKDHGLQLDPL